MNVEDMAKNEEIKPGARLEATDASRVNGDGGSGVVPSDEKDGLLDMIRREKNDQARHLVESGWMGDPRNLEFPGSNGDGAYTSIVSAAVGETERVHKQHLRALQETHQQQYPEFRLTKRGSQAKLNIHQTPMKDLLDKDKQPNHLRKLHVIELYSAVSFANQYGIAMNAHVAIRWDLLGIDDHAEAAGLLQEKFLKHLNQLHKDKIIAGVKRNGGNANQDQLHWIYVHECPPPNYCFHTHLLVGVPCGTENQFAAWVLARIKDISRAPSFDPDAVRVVCPTTVGPSDEQLIARQWVWLQYFCKGLDPKAKVKVAGYDDPVPLSHFIKSAYISPGPIKCWRRIGMSRNLRRNIRLGAGFKSEMELGRFDNRTLYTSILFDSWHAKAKLRRDAQPDMSEVFGKFFGEPPKTSEVEQAKTSDFNPFSR